MTEPSEPRSEAAEHFVLDEECVVEQLLLPAWGNAVRQGRIDAARAEVRAHLDRLCAAGLGFRTKDGRRWFDPVQLNFITDRGRSHHDPFWNEHVVPTRRRSLARIAPPAPPSARYHDPRRVTLTFRRELPFPHREPGSRVLVTLPMPVEEPTQRHLTITSDVSGDGSVRLEHGSLTARTTVGPDRIVRVTTRIELVGYQQTVNIDPTLLVPADADDPALRPYLVGEEDIIRVTPAIVAMAKRHARATIWDTVLALWESFFDERVIGSLYHFRLDPADPLGTATKYVDCYVGSALFIAMLRANGIPARMVQGALMNPGVDQGHHFWTEMWLPPYGWVPADLVSWGLALGDKHDLAWSRHLLGHLPYQLVTLRLPRERMELGLTYPKRWYSTSIIEGAGQLNTVFDLDTHAVAVRDYYEASVGERIEEASA